MNTEKPKKKQFKLTRNNTKKTHQQFVSLVWQSTSEKKKLSGIHIEFVIDFLHALVRNTKVTHRIPLVRISNSTQNSDRIS